MDKTETYIKQADNPDIQGLRRTLYGDFIARRSTGAVKIYPEGWAIDTIWLPQQDQLQEMVMPKWKFVAGGDYDHPLAELLRKFTRFWGSFSMSEAISMEQLWLAFVMAEKFNKQWDGERWVALAEVKVC